MRSLNTSAWIGFWSGLALIACAWIIGCQLSTTPGSTATLSTTQPSTQPVATVTVSTPANLQTVLQDVLPFVSAGAAIPSPASPYLALAAGILTLLIGGGATVAVNASNKSAANSQAVTAAHAQVMTQAVAALANSTPVTAPSPPPASPPKSA
jgi:hypothetical protein